MGLAGAKNKRKLGNDPNNTKWSRNTDTFGQKMLRAQGWQPGQYLGAKDAPHAEWHTEANTTHIRVTLKDDTLGLGAKRNNGDECTGLDAFQHLLGRLNGKSDDTLETERKVREDLKLNLYMERKIGAIRFVKGGWLVGDQVKETPDENAVEPQSEAVSDDAKDSEASSASESTEPKSKKRKADEDAQPDDEKARKKEKSKKRKTDSDAESDHVKEKKDKKKSKKRRTESEEEEEASSKSSKGKKEKKLKKDKKEKKEKKDKKEKKEKKKDRAASDSGTEEDSTSKEKKRRQDKSSVSTPAESGASTPSGSGYSTPVTTSTRYLARSRFIAQKKMAFADSAALNQIFMIKS